MEWLIIIIIIVGLFNNRYKPIVRQNSYKTYLNSSHWRSTRKRLLKKYNYKCAFCGSTKNLNVHHKTYKRLGHELDSDLIVLCNYHHKKIHNKL